MTAWLLRLLGAPVEQAEGIADASLAFRGGLSPGWFVFYLLLIGACVYWLYRTTPILLSPGRRRLLTALRVVFLGLLLLLLLRPVLAFTVEGSVRRLLVLLVDGSQSMQIADPRVLPEDQKRAAIALGDLDPARGLDQPLPSSSSQAWTEISRLGLVQAVLQNPKLDLLPRLEQAFDLEVYTCGRGLWPVAPLSEAASQAPTNASPATTESGRAEPAAGAQRMRAGERRWIARLTATNTITALGDALQELVNRKRGQPLAGIWLMSDGANNSGRQPREVAAALRQEGVPLYIYGVGVTEPRDLIVAQIFAPDIAFVDDRVEVTVRVRAQGLRGESAELVLALGSEEVARRRLEFTGAEEQVVPIAFVPHTKGTYDLVASIAPREDEAVTANNQRSHRMRVIDARIRMLLADQAPRWEFRYLQAMFLRDRRVQLKCFLAEADPAVARVENTPYLERLPTSRSELFQYDVIVLGDLSRQILSRNQLDMIRQWVSDFGGGLIVLAGRRHMPLAYGDTVLEKMLPVEFDNSFVRAGGAAPADKPIHLELTATGRASPMLRLADDPNANLDLWRSLPPVYWVARVARPKPAAEVLLVDPDPARESRFGKMPVLALQQYGLGQVIFVGTDNFWRWRKNVGDAYHTALWGQMVQRLALPRLLGNSRRTQLSTDRQNYMTGERISIYARLYGVGFEPIEAPQIKGHYGLRDGTGPRPEVTLRAVPGQPGLYRGEFIAPMPGDYQFWVEPDLNTFLDFTVAEPQFELSQTAMDAPLLREMAGVTGGAFFREEDLQRLPETIQERTERVRSPVELELWSSPLYFLLLLGVVTAEWILRKLSHLK